MVQATNWYEEKLGWGTLGQFHSISIDGKEFSLYEKLTVTTNDNQSYFGEIVDITERNIGFITKDRHFKIINLDEIMSLHY